VARSGLLDHGAWLRASAFASVFAVIALVATSSQGRDIFGHPLGTDFISFWAVAQLPLDQVYDADLHFVKQKAIFPVEEYTAFYYPPVFALYCLIFSGVPYFVALSLFLVVTCGMYYFSLSKWVCSGTLMIMLAFPAFFLTVGHGQNSFLAAALVGGGMFLLKDRPVVAGILFGLLIFKPQLGLLIPVLLIFGRHVQAFLSASSTVLCLCLLSSWVFGIDVWADWLETTTAATNTMEHGLVGYADMQTVFASARLLGAEESIAYAVQGAVSLIAVAAVAIIAHHQPYCLGVGAFTIVASFLATPFALYYDLTLAAFAICYLINCPNKNINERTAIALSFASPLLGFVLASFGAPVQPLILAMLALVIWIRVFGGSHPFKPAPTGAAGALLPSPSHQEIQASSRFRPIGFREVIEPIEDIADGRVIDPDEVDS